MWPRAMYSLLLLLMLLLCAHARALGTTGGGGGWGATTAGSAEATSGKAVCMDCCGYAECTDAMCRHSACFHDDFCCTHWDKVCGNFAMDYCDGCAVSCGTSDCGSAHELFDGGCSDQACEEAVCSADAYCCDTTFDSLCADRAWQTCSVCQNVTCNTGTGQTSATGGIVSVGSTTGGQQPACTNTDETACCSCETSTPGCPDADCMAKVCERDAYCCEEAFDKLCTSYARDKCDICGGGGGGGSFGGGTRGGATHGGGGWTGGSTTSGAFGASTTSYRETFGASTTGLAGGSGVGPLPAGDCCATEHTDTRVDAIGCNDETCMHIVCELRDSCCEAAWSSACADEARELCACGRTDVSDSSCCAESDEGVRGCDDARCEAAVCDKDEFCCSNEWDFTCVQEAFAVAACPCNLNDGDVPVAGSDAATATDGDDTVTVTIDKSVLVFAGIVAAAVVGLCCVFTAMYYLRRHASSKHEYEMLSFEDDLVLD